MGEGTVWQWFLPIRKHSDVVVEKQDYTVTGDPHIKDGQAEGDHLYGITEEIEN